MLATETVLLETRGIRTDGRPVRSARLGHGSESDIEQEQMVI